MRGFLFIRVLSIFFLYHLQADLILNLIFGLIAENLFNKASIRTISSVVESRLCEITSSRAAYRAPPVAVRTWVVALRTAALA